jgi:phage baseplate assembly protein W
MDWSAMSSAISFPFTLDPFGVLETTDLPSKIWTDRVLTLLSTNIGQRPILTDYGTDIMRYLFENENNTALGVDQAIRSAIANWLPEISVKEISITNVDSEGRLVVELTILLPDSTIKTLDVSKAILSLDGTITIAS